MARRLDLTEEFLQCCKVTFFCQYNKIELLKSP